MTYHAFSFCLLFLLLCACFFQFQFHPTFLWLTTFPLRSTLIALCMYVYVYVYRHTHTHTHFQIPFPYRSFSSVQSLSRVQLFATPLIAACQASLSITNSRISLKLMSIESVMPSSHLILCYPLLLLPPIPPSIRGFSSESTLRMRQPKYWSFSFSTSPSN